MIVGQAIDRVDGPAKVTGRVKYAAEFDVPGLVHAVLVQSTVAAGRIAGFDTAEAAGLPGVLAIITPDNAERLHTVKGAQQTITAPLLQNADIVFNGQHVAVVVATSLEQATAAAAAVRVRYDAAEAVTRMESVLDQAYPPKDFRNGQRPPDSSRGDPDAAFAAAAVKVDATYVTPFEHHNPMEPHATIARWSRDAKGDRLEVWTATQGIGGARQTLATLFDLPPDRVEVRDPFVGGGFGCKGNTWPPATLAAMAARRVGRPVKLVLTRRQMFTSNGYRPQTIQQLKLAAGSNGELAAIRHDSFTSMSQPVLGEFAEPCGVATEMLYACPNVGVTHRLVAMNMSLPTYMRAPGEAPGMFALEVAMDELAVGLRMDPIALRLANYTEVDQHENKPFSSKKLRECYARGAEAFGWARRSPEPRSMRDGSQLVGLGMATSTYPTNRSRAAARVRLHADGTALVQCATQDLGTGTYTVMSQVAADELDLPVSRIRFQLGDSSFPPAPVSGGSQTVASVAPAVQAACAAARAQLISMAAADPALGLGDAPPDSIVFQNGILIGPAARVPMGQVLAHAGLEFVEAEGSSDAGQGKDTHSLHAFGAQFCEVRVDMDLGQVRISRFVGAFEAGRILNPKTARSQALGGITFGIGQALLEQTLVDEASGRIANANVSEYLMPVNADIPDIQIILVDSDDRIVNPVGAKGIGELPMVGAAAAVTNAVYHATGVRVRKLPIRIEDLLTT